LKRPALPLITAALLAGCQTIPADHSRGIDSRRAVQLARADAALRHVSIAGFHLLVGDEGESWRVTFVDPHAHAIGSDRFEWIVDKHKAVVLMMPVLE
jgi:hypothetical protein